MTQPEVPGNNDDVIRVVYQAVADYSQMLRETRRAREETRALKADLDTLAGSSTHKVKVTADTGQARTELAAVLRDIVVKIKVTVDALAANTELQRVLRDVTVKAKLILDTTAVRTDLAAIRARLGELREWSIGVKLHDAGIGRQLDALKTRLRQQLPEVQIGTHLDVAGITERFRALLAHLESMGPVDIDVRINDRVLARIEAAADRLKLIRDKVQGGGGGPGGGGGLLSGLAGVAEGAAGAAANAGSAVAGVATDVGQSAANTAKQGADEATESIAQMSEGVGGLVTGGVKLVAMIALVQLAMAAVVPVIAAAALAVGTLAATFATAGAATAIFAVGAVGAFSKVTAAVQAYEKSGTVAQGPLGQVVDKFEQLKRHYNELGKTVDTPIFELFGKGLQLAIDLLDKVEPLITVVTHAMSGALDIVAASLTGPAMDRFLAFVERSAPEAITDLTTGLTGFGEGLGSLLEQFEPFIREFVRGFADAGQSFARWAAGLGQDEQFQQFLTYAREQLPKLIDLVKNLLVFLGHLFVALEPFGSALLSFADGLSKILAALPPHLLQALMFGLLGVVVALGQVLDLNFSPIAEIATAFTDMQSAVAALAKALGPLVTALRTVLDTLTAVKNAAGGQVLAAIAAALGVTTTTGTGDGTGDGSGDSSGDGGGFTYDPGGGTPSAGAPAAPADPHQRAVKRVKDLIAAGHDVNSQPVRTAQADALAGSAATGTAGGFLGVGATRQTVTLTGVAKAAGIDQDTLVAGTLGDSAAQDKALGKMEAYRKSLLEQAAAGGKNADALKAQAAAVTKLEEQYRTASLSSSELTDTSTKGAGAYTTEAQAVDALKKALATSTADPNVALYDNAVQAMQAYDQAVQAKKDAENANTDAEITARRATEDLAAARVAAVQRVRDLQRSLRDIAIDERQAKLSVKEADDNLAKLIANGGTADQIEQARIDAERAHNALNDFEQDKGAKTKAARDELAKGITGNRALQDAERTNRDAQANLTKAHTNLLTATNQLIDLHLKFDQAAGALGLTEDQVRTLKTHVDALKGKTLKITADTTDARQKMAALFQGMVALQLMAADPKLSGQKAWDNAAGSVPSTLAGEGARKAGAGVAGAAKKLAALLADGGPAVASATTSGAVHGPGTGVSDSIAVRLPVGGDARLSRGEHIVTDGEVQRAPGGHAYLEAFRAGLRSGRPWEPPTLRRAGGGPAGPVRSAVLPIFRMPVAAPALTTTAPGYAAGGAALATAATVTDRSVTVHVGTINNPVPEPAATSIYRQVRNAVEGDER